MKKQNKQVWYVLAAAMLAASLNACANNDASEEIATTNQLSVIQTEAVTVSEEQMYIDALPGADFDGEVFSILANATTHGTISYDTEAETGETFNDFIYARNRAVEERYNITIELTQDDNVDSIARNMVTAGEDTYDMISSWIKNVLVNATGGYFYNLHDIPTIDLQKPWWDAQCSELLTISDRLYVAFSDMNVQPLDLLGGTCVNNELVKQYDLPSPQEAVYAGTWTMDLAYEMMRRVAGDTNGDGSMGEADTWGYITGIGDINALMIAADRHYITLDSNGEMQLNYSSEPVVAAAEKMEKLILDTSTSVYLNNHSWGSSVFQDNRALFQATTVRSYYHSWRSWDLDITLLPPPKFDETQESYHSMMSNCSMGVSVPATASDIERTGTIIEALNAYSYNAIDEVYYELTLQDKLARDEDSVRMLDMITEARVVDIAVLNESAWGDVIWAFLNSFEKNGSAQLASLTEKHQKAFEKIRNDIVEAYESLDN